MHHRFAPLADDTTARAKPLPLPSLPWGELLIMAVMAVLLLRLP